MSTVAEDRLTVGLAYAPAAIAALFSAAGVLESSAFPAINGVACATAAVMFGISAKGAARLGAEGTLIANTVASLVLAVYTVTYALFVTERIDQAALAAVNRPLFPLLLTSTIVGPAMFRRWRTRRSRELLATLKRIGV